MSLSIKDYSSDFTAMKPKTS